ncbi:hypothetical protein RIF29_04556 [Crotalaria pallida]|uniref:Uncharacterized protein n=1 Tax=Crotalaria pallida TaxID=3830 RepID=A0AAN9J151_CROPI
MARKRGRPPKTSSSSAKKQLNAHDVDDGIQKKLDVTLLDDEDLEEIDNLTPKKAEELLKNLDVLHEKIKEKAIVQNDNPGSTNVDKEKEDQPAPQTNPKPASTAKQPSSCRKNVKKLWVEKKRPSRDDIEKIDDALRAEDDTAVANAVAIANSTGVQDSQSIGTVVAETVLEVKGDTSPDVVVSSKEPKENGS